MKKNHILVIALLVITISYGQTTKTFEGSIDALWNTAGNWDDGIPTSDDSVLLSASEAISSTINSTFTVTKVEVTGNTNVTLYSDPLFSGHRLKLDTKESSVADALLNNLDDAGLTLTIDAALRFDNTSANATLRVRNSNVSNTLEFSAASSFYVEKYVLINNAGVVNLKGTMTGTSGRVLFVGAGTTNLDSRLGLSTIGQIRFGANNSIININGDNSANAAAANTSMDMWFSEDKINTVNLNAENCLQLDELYLLKGSQTTFNLSHNQSNVGILKIGSVFGSDETVGLATVNLNLDSNDCSFSDSNGAWHGSSFLNITDFVIDDSVTPNTSNVRFGTDANGLSSAQLSQISVDLAGDGSLVLNENGYLIFESILSVTGENAIDFAMYPNPVVDVLTITSEESIAKYEVLNLVGTTVVSVSSIENGLDVSNLTSGVYILRLTSANGISTTKFVKK